MTPEQREKRRAYRAAYYLAHREKVLAQSAAYYVEHREERRADYLAHRDERLAARAAHRAAHPEKIRASAAAHYAANREKLNAASRAWRAALKPVVYVWVAPDGRADYVGRGTTVRSQAHANKPWWTPEHLLLSMTCDSEWQAMEYEGRWGAFYRPRHNKEGYRHAA